MHDEYLQFPVYQVDAFTREIFHGNPAGVLPHADGLTGTQMQDIARELNNSGEAVIAFCATLTLACPSSLF